MYFSPCRYLFLAISLALSLVRQLNQVLIEASSDLLEQGNLFSISMQTKPRCLRAGFSHFTRFFPHEWLCFLACLAYLKNGKQTKPIAPKNCVVK